MSRRLAAASAVLILLLSACSDEPAPPPTAGGSETQGQDGAAPKSDRKKQRSERRSEGDGGRDRSGARRGSDGEVGAEDGKAREDPPSDEKSDERQESAPYPSSGRYVYSQEGYEEFCQTTSCDRKPLPSEQPVEIVYKSRSGSEAIIVSETESGDRLTRTTFRFTPRHAYVTEVYTRFNYEGVRFEDSYRPDPPVDALRFPLVTGRSWAGRWKDKTSGRYRISVGERQHVEAAGRDVVAYRIETQIRFSGQFDGSSSSVLWFDPQTKTIVRSQGEIDTRSAFGRYHSRFSTILSSGPGF